MNTDAKGRPLPTASTTLHELLRLGARVSFGERSMQGDPRDGYIQVSNAFGSLGLWDMDNAQGVDNAVNDLAKDAREHGYDLHGEVLPPQE